MEYNQTKRDVICIKCRLVRKTDETDPRCLDCGNIMITTVRSLVTGEIFTEEDRKGINE